MDTKMFLNGTVHFGFLSSKCILYLNAVHSKFLAE